VADLDAINAELAAARSKLGTKSKDRSTRGKAVRAAISTGPEWRSSVFSVRCLPDIPATIKRLAAAKGVSVAEWFEAVIEAEARKEE
jgi:hypothetical protein